MRSSTGLKVLCFIFRGKNDRGKRTLRGSAQAHILVGQQLPRGWAMTIPISRTNLKLSFAALQHLAVSSCQRGIFPLAFIVFQIFHGSETKD